MTQQIKESDWMLLQQLHPVALERFCQNVLSEIQGVHAEGDKSFHRRYLDIYELIQSRDEEISYGFEGLRRPNALMVLSFIRSQDLLAEEEFARFSQETREVVESMLGVDF